MSIVRVVHNRDNPYKAINTSICTDKRLSWKAKGLWFYAFSRPDDWQFYVSEIVTQSTDGRDSVRGILNELENCGYLIRQQDRNEKGRFKKWDWILFETTQLAEEFQKKFPKPENPAPVSSAPVNRPLLNIDKTNIEKLTNPPTPQSPEPKAEPKKLVSFSLSEKEELLSDFELSSSEMKSLLSQTQELSLDVFKESIQAFLDYRKKTDVQSNFAVLWKALGCGGDQPWQAKDCNSIEEKNKAIADKLKITNGQTIRGWLFSRCNDCIEFSHACHSKVFEFSSHSFEKNLRDFLEKLGESALLNA